MVVWIRLSYNAFCRSVVLVQIFACAYSIATVNVHSGNPSDHFVHRHTHRVVRGTLLLCGRPDGRLSALTTAEAATCLSVNQASSIQSLGGTCETVTIGHNPFKLPLSKKAIFLKRKRPLFLCERLLVENDAETQQSEASLLSSIRPSGRSSSSSGSRRPTSSNSRSGKSLWRRLLSSGSSPGNENLELSLSLHPMDCSVHLLRHLQRSAPALIGAYSNMEREFDLNAVKGDVVKQSNTERNGSENAKGMFQAMDIKGDGLLDLEEFLSGFYLLRVGLSEDRAREIFHLADMESSGFLSFEEFLVLLEMLNLQNSSLKTPTSVRDERGIIQITASRERYFGELTRKLNAGKSSGKHLDFHLTRSQHLSQELYETRVASLQRFVSMTVMFHQMGMRVQSFFQRISFGALGYHMDKTHSIMRVATTASPVSGAHVRQRRQQLQQYNKVKHSVAVISTAYLKFKERKLAARQNS